MQQIIAGATAAPFPEGHAHAIQLRARVRIATHRGAGQANAGVNLSRLGRSITYLSVLRASAVVSCLSTPFARGLCDTPLIALPHPPHTWPPAPASTRAPPITPILVPAPGRTMLIC